MGLDSKDEQLGITANTCFICEEENMDCPDMDWTVPANTVLELIQIRM
jgi:hypothetical protein